MKLSMMNACSSGVRAAHGGNAERRRYIKRAAVVALGILVLTALMLSQSNQPLRPLSDLIPASPLIYVEARDLGAALKEWNGSKVKADWVASPNYKAFAQSRLFMRLDLAQTEYAAAAGFAPDMPFVEAVAGANSALALYDIGELQFLYITRMPQARAYQSMLWQSRAKFQPRRAGGIDYYVRQQQGRRAVFAVTNDLLLIATDEQAMAGALELIAGQTRPRMRDESWYQSSAAAQPQSGDFRMVHNFARVVKTPYFRSYWVQRNSRELDQFTAFISDLDRSAAEFRERRVLLRDDAAADLRPAEAGVGELLRFVPADAGLYRAWARPSLDTAAAFIIEKSSGRGATAQGQQRYAPAAENPDVSAGSEQDIEVRVDEPQLRDDVRTADAGALRTLLNGNAVQAMLEVQTAQAGADGVFIGTPGAIALLGERAWNAAAARSAVAAMVSAGWTVGGIGAGWTGQNVQTLTGLRKVAIAVSDRVLIVGNAEAVVAAMIARTGAQQGGAAYAARFQHARELPKFERMMRLIDAPALRGSTGDNREPLFFSENLASLGRALGRVGDVSIESHDDGRAVRQTVVYRLQ